MLNRKKKLKNTKKLKTNSKRCNFGSKIHNRNCLPNLLPHFKQLSFFEHLNLSSLSKVMDI